MPHILVERGLAYIGHLPYVMLLKIRMSKGKKLFTQFSNLHHTQMPTAYCSFENDSWLLIIQVHVVQVYIYLLTEQRDTHAIITVIAYIA